MKKSFLAIILIMLCSTVWAKEFNVMDYNAVADGKTDNTLAFQKALDAAGKTCGIVSVPFGKYRFNGCLTIPEGVALIGTWQGPHTPDIDKGSTLLVYGGRDKENSTPFITMSGNSTLKGISIYYPEQKLPDIHPYPWTIRRNGFRCNMIDLAIANTYNGIDCGTVATGGHHLRNIDMCALRRGVYIDRTYDIGRIENVHIHNLSWIASGEKEQELWKYLLANLEGFIIGKCDWEYMVDCFVICTKTGFHFVEMELAPGQQRGVAEQGNIMITQSGADLCFNGVLIDKVQEHAGIAFENCQFMSGIEINEDNLGPVKLTNCGFWGVSRTGSVIINKGQGTLFLNSCHFSAWDDDRFRPGFKWDPKVPFINCTGGSLHMTSCMFKDIGNTPDAHIFLGENVRSATIIGNNVEKGKLNIISKTKGDVQAIGNATEN